VSKNERRYFENKRKKGEAECRNKKRYKDKALAERSIQQWQKHSTREKKPCRAYECPFCHGWHLSSKGLYD
jgi:hypothetical protein